MNIQEIIVIFMILASVLYTAYSVVQIFVKKKDNSCGCSSCDIKDITKDLRSLANKKIH